MTLNRWLSSVWKFPMGFETTQVHRYCHVLPIVWKFPMGFETCEVFHKDTDIHWAFESSLWDLKLDVVHFFLWCIYLVWKFPMGFETLWARGESPLTPFVWKFPMGFETALSVPNRLGSGGVWKFPMGFETNTFPSTSPPPIVWKFPMGFETRWVKALIEEGLIGLKVPYGIWNSINFLNLPIEKGLKVPYGIWNEKLGVDFWPKMSLKVPYGIWNCWGYSTSFDLSRYVWKFPMGFETISASIETRTSWQFESSLWDLKLSTDNPRFFFMSEFESSLWDLKLIG